MVQIYIFGVSNVVPVKRHGDFTELKDGSAQSDTLEPVEYKKTIRSNLIKVQSGGQYIDEWNKWAKSEGFNWSFLTEDRWIYYGPGECKAFYTLMKVEWLPLLEKYKIDLEKLMGIVDLYHYNDTYPELSYYYKLMSAFKLGADNGFVAIVS